MKSALIWHQNHWKPLSALLLPRFSQSLGNPTSFPALQMMDVCTHPPGLTKIISWILWLGWLSIRHDLRAARGDVCFEMLGKVFHIREELQPGTSSCHGIVPGSSSSAHTPCPAQPFPAPTPQEGTPPWEWDLWGKISNIPLGMCKRRSAPRLKWKSGKLCIFPLGDVGSWKGLGFAEGEQQHNIQV